MLCPKCGGDSGVKDSRPDYQGVVIRRRRKCFECGFKFTTKEIVVSSSETNKLVREMELRTTNALINKVNVILEDLLTHKRLLEKIKDENEKV